MKKDTLIVNAGRAPEETHGVVNPPVYRASTVTFPTVEALEGAERDPFEGVYYGRFGTPTTFAFEEAVAALEGGGRAATFSSGLAAIAGTLFAFLGAGDHLLMTDSVYAPTRRFCNTVLARFGVEVTYYDPLAGSDVAGLMKENTKVVFLESPGSLTFEVQDVPAIAEAAHARGALVLLDNTWASPLYFKPFAHGVDVSIQAGTKYIAGHSDLVLGTITTRDEALYRAIKDQTAVMGDVAGPDECYLALRGLRTLGVRLRQQERSALRIARWLQERPQVKRVLYPALPEDPGHALWKRDFLGASGLFAIVLHATEEAAVARMVDGLRLFAIGSSWGGYESLVSTADVGALRSAVPWTEPGYLLRLHIGLEDPDELIADLEAGLERLAG